MAMTSASKALSGGSIPSTPAMKFKSLISKPIKVNEKARGVLVILLGLVILVLFGFVLPSAGTFFLQRDAFINEYTLSESQKIALALLGLVAGLAPVYVGLTGGYLAKRRGWLYGALPPILLMLLMSGYYLFSLYYPEVIFGELFDTPQEFKDILLSQTRQGLYSTISSGIRAAIIAGLCGLVGEQVAKKKSEIRDNQSAHSDKLNKIA